MKLSKNMIIGILVVSIGFAFFRYLISNQEVKWSEEAKIIAQGICASQYLNAQGLKDWSLHKLEAEDELGYKKVLNCGNSFESKYHPQVFFNTFKSDANGIAIEARTYLK